MAKVKPVEHRRGQPDTRYTRTDPDGSRVRLITNGDGVVAVTTAAERRAADAWGLPVTRVPNLDTKEAPDGR